MRIITKDITTVKSDAILINGVNCQRRMGSGVAKAYLDKWPQVKAKYLKTPPKLGHVSYINVGSKLYVANCYTQEFYGYDGKRYADLHSIRVSFSEAIQKCMLFSLDLYTPMVGCGLGGLDWDTEVKPALEKLEEYYGFEIIVCTI